MHVYGLLFFLIACADPFQGKSPLRFQEKISKEDLEVQKFQALKAEKEQAWASLVADAKTSFTSIQPIIERKCSSCHDSRFKLPFYGKILPKINPVARHQAEGLPALDFAPLFPLKSKGSSNQVALLTALRHSIVERSMPLKSYTLIYPKRKVSDEDQEAILGWIDPLLERIKDFEHRYGENLSGPKAQAYAIFEQKCFRCHAHGRAKGHFGDMQDSTLLLKSKYIQLKDPESSTFYRLMTDKKMPPNKKEALTPDELLVVRDWLALESDLSRK